MIDIVILSNGPGEIATWVKPVVQALRRRDQKLRISVILSPCPHASGHEHITALSYPEVDRVQPAAAFWRFLLTGQTAADWDWSPQGVVVFLGGDQLYAVVAGRWLGYGTVVYAEWEGRWQRWVSAFGAMQPQVVERAAPQHRPKFSVVGDLMADVAVGDARSPVEAALNLGPNTELLGLLPGSKRGKLELGVPLVCAIAQFLHVRRPNLRYVIPVAPTLDLETLVGYGDPAQNPACNLFDAPPVQLVKTADRPYLLVAEQIRIELWTPFPAFDLLSRCQLCLTTVGANTAQIGALAVPMLVLLPTQQMGVEVNWDGLPGLVGNLPGVGKSARKLVNHAALAIIRRRSLRFAWPNLWARRLGQVPDAVPELLGHLSGESVGKQVIDYLDHPEKLAAMRQRLRLLRGPAGAAENMADLILAAVP